MKLDACIKKINKYLASNDAQPLLVDIQNSDDLEKVLTHFGVDGNLILDASKFCKKTNYLEWKPCWKIFLQKQRIVSLLV